MARNYMVTIRDDDGTDHVVLVQRNTRPSAERAARARLLRENKITLLNRGTLVSILHVGAP